MKIQINRLVIAIAAIIVIVGGMFAMLNAMLN